jgi:hypothetical protein
MIHRMHPCFHNKWSKLNKEGVTIHMSRMVAGGGGVDEYG